MPPESWERQLAEQKASTYDEAIRQARAAMGMLGEVYAENKRLKAELAEIKQRMEARE